MQTAQGSSPSAEAGFTSAQDFLIPSTFLSPQDHSRKVLTWTSNGLSPPITMVLDRFLLQAISQYHENVRSSRWFEGEVTTHAATTPNLYSSYHLLVTLKKLQCLSETYPLQDIVDCLSIGVRNYYQTLLSLPTDDVSAVLEVRLSLALYRLVYVWTPYQWQTFTLLNYSMLEYRPTARLSLGQGDQMIEITYHPSDPSILFEEY